jgi:hypothetical protein
MYLSLHIFSVFGQNFTINTEFSTKHEVLKKSQRAQAMPGVNVKEKKERGKKKGKMKL